MRLFGCGAYLPDIVNGMISWQTSTFFFYYFKPVISLVWFWFGGGFVFKTHTGMRQKFRNKRNNILRKKD